MKTFAAHFETFPEPYRCEALRLCPKAFLTDTCKSASYALSGSFVWDLERNTTLISFDQWCIFHDALKLSEKSNSPSFKSF